MGYSEDDRFVRVDFFKPYGKWYTTEAVLWVNRDDGDVIAEFYDSLKEHFASQPQRLRGMWAVCLKANNKNSFPMMVKLPDA